ncbi:TIGR03620 family F420-dependent LLM class oxidoreductase [Cellulomonas citrea]|uniref:TIGR03620 family F420-dependent LLM class oxidoreductase n=1 Tax=Cellulomonas citrea TaxID=1909423 RepID=UPI00135923B4|nr:TIGR03620 family F420-dependent LLM class oxidoreductase [Cellulomonas citrea]
MTVQLGRYGVWVRAAWLDGALAARVEELGYGALWVGGSPEGDLGLVEQLLGATSRITVATSVVNMWRSPATQVAAAYRRLADRYGDRLLLGVGVGHREATAEYASPYETIVRYLDALDEAGVSVDVRVLAALGPRVQQLAAQRAAGAIPYLTTPEHTAAARALLGDRPLLAPEQKVVLADALGLDEQAARELARGAVRTPYLGLSNYRRSLRTQGFTDAEMDAAADRVVDALAPQGTVEHAVAALDAHLAAGADHVAAQLVVPDPAGLDIALRALAVRLPLG